ncbi:MAG: GGDEF domain-containing protein [Oscillospiraceae bacterium]|nr:GGDEF domain-containing protein [Oscillospiraceae bacterium]
MENKNLTFVNLALALANDYSSLYVIDSRNDSYAEYAVSGDEKELLLVSRGENFFMDVTKNCREQVWPDDQEYFLNMFRKENVQKALKDGRSFSLTYRLRIDGKPRYFFLKTIQAHDSSIVIGVQDVDVQKRKELESEAQKSTYSEIAEALASRYEVIYYVDTETNEYTQYSASEQYAKLGMTKQGENFFTDASRDIETYIHPEDKQEILAKMEKSQLMQNLKQNGTVSLRYRQLLDGRQQYMNMLIVQPKNKTGRIVVGVFNTDARVRHEQSIEREKSTFSDISTALAQRYEVIYHVNVITNEYSEYSTNSKYSKLEAGAKGKDFFAETQINLKKDIYPDDQPMMAISLQKENLLNSLSAFGKTILNYRLLLDGRPQYVSMYAVRPKEDSEHIIVAVANVDEAKRMELAYLDAVDMANKDAMTGVKNKRAYVQAEIELDEQIKDSQNEPFAVVVCDVNGLKQVNDTQGHKAGDEFIRKACSVICNTFKHSPVFRIGGDEFAVILKNQDYQNRTALMQQLADVLEEQKQNHLLLLAAGFSEFQPEKDIRVQDVFERADSLMYLNKKQCKAGII